MKFLVMIVLLISGFQSFAAEYIEESFEGQSSESSPLAAKKDIIDQAIQKVSEGLLIKKLGSAKFNKNKSVMRSVISESDRYILFMKTSEVFSLESGGFKMSVSLKISEVNLMALLRRKGLMQEGNLQPVLLPQITYKTDRGVFKWWEGVSHPQEAELEDRLQSALLASHIFVLKPGTMKLSPQIQKEEGITLSLKGELILDPPMRFSAIVVFQGTQQRVAETKFEFKSFTEFEENLKLDLGTQLEESWNRGTLGAYDILLEFQESFSFKEQEALKDFLSQRTEIKTVKERRMGSQEFVLLISSSLSSRELKFPPLKFGDKIYKVSSVEDNKIVFSKTR